ncbi:MAG: L-seryl-tRNA(Sec) selenium transferase [Oscillospiraceae bacterium]
MDNNENPLRLLPQADAVLRSAECTGLIAEYGDALCAIAVKNALCAMRQSILNNGCADTSVLGVVNAAGLLLKSPVSPCPVINATGIALHTNLGRAPLAEEARAAVQNACGYTDIEYDLTSGKRGERGKEANALLCRLTGCEAALCVNNNAAALLLALTVMCEGKDVVVSRGELVEIGGSFRVSDIMQLCGGKIHEVGTTNRTHLSDYEKAVSNAGVILKVHTSNFLQLGFTCEASISQLAELAHHNRLPLLADLGSGALLPENEYPFNEPCVPMGVKSGADVLVFSGDKLLGGPQCGIICGKKEWIEKMRTFPLARALRIDKLSLAALTATLRLYQSPKAAKERVPVLHMLCQGEEELLQKANALKNALAKRTQYECDIMPTMRPVGGGSVPGVELKSYAVAIKVRDADAFAAALRLAKTPIIAIIRDSRVVMDIACMSLEEIENAAEIISDLDNSAYL